MKPTFQPASVSFGPNENSACPPNWTPVFTAGLLFDSWNLTIPSGTHLQSVIYLNVTISCSALILSGIIKILTDDGLMLILISRSHASVDNIQEIWKWYVRGLGKRRGSASLRSSSLSSAAIVILPTMLSTFRS